MEILNVGVNHKKGQPVRAGQSARRRGAIRYRLAIAIRHQMPTAAIQPKNNVVIIFAPNPVCKLHPAEESVLPANRPR